MNTNIGTSDGLNVYRELINKEAAGNANWYICACAPALE